MKNIFQECLSLLFMLFCIYFLSGCETPSQPATTDMIILIGNHANSAKITPPIGDAVEKVYSSFGNIAIIVIDGNPAIAKDPNGNIIGSYNAELNKKSRKTFYDNREVWEKRIFTPRKQNVIKKMDELSADSPEVDLITSLFEALKAFNTIKSDEDCVKEIIIIDTGLSTTGPLNFLNSELFALVQQDRKLTSEDIRPVINNLDAKASLPDLSGIAVTWYGLGYVCSPQCELDQLAKYNLRVIWGEILKSCNALKSPYANADAEYGIFIETLAEGRINCDYEVTPVNPADSEDSNPIDIKEPLISDSIPDSITDKELRFKKNSSEYTNNELALSILEPYAEKLLAYPDTDILLVGTVSDPNRNGGDIELSQKRAEAVKESLIKLGISENRIIACGIGSNRYLPDLYNTNEWQRNKYIESEAEKNRAVHIIPLDSELAKKILTAIP